MIRIPFWLWAYVLLSLAAGTLAVLIAGDDAGWPVTIVFLAALILRRWRRSRAAEQAEARPREAFADLVARSKRMRATDILVAIQQDPFFAALYKTLDDENRQVFVRYVNIKHGLDTGQIKASAVEEARLTLEMIEADHLTPDLMERLKSAKERRDAIENHPSRTEREDAAL